METPKNTLPTNTNTLAEQPQIPTMETAAGFSPKLSDYELSREERIKENRERMQKLGISDLSLKLNVLITPPSRRSYQRKAHQSDTPLPPSGPARRSSRLQNSTPVSYCEVPVPKKERCSNDDDIRREVGSRPEEYTEEHDKLLGSFEKSWIPFVDGYGKDGKRIYDPVKGKTCHQCRQKTLGHRTRCSQCTLVQGQFCGDCLYMRYGENVLEANENPDWVCPVCRGICNCSLCRQAKGWPATGTLYRKISSLGFKSVAHYLIQTRRANTELDNSSNDDKSGAEHVHVSAKRSLPFSDANATKGGNEDLSKTSNGDLGADHPITKLGEESGDSKINLESEVEPPLKPGPEIIDELNESTIKPGTDAETEATIEPPNDDIVIKKANKLDFEVKSSVVLVEKNPKSSKKSVGYEPKTPESIGGRLRQRRDQTDGTIARRVWGMSKKSVGYEPKTPESIGGRLRQRRDQTDGTIARRVWGMSKKSVGYEPKTPESIGGRLRQRRDQTDGTIASRLKGRRLVQ